MNAASRRRGCLLGGAIGDALGAPVEFMDLREIRSRFGSQGLADLAPENGGAITDDTQMTMFTAEGLIRAHVRWLGRGICHPPSVVNGAYLRWLATQDVDFGDADADGWLITHAQLFARRDPGETCLSALRSGRRGTPTERINDSKGCGGVMRMAPVGLIAVNPFGLGAELAALTHGHPSGFLAAGAFALMIARLYAGGTMLEAVQEALSRLEREPEGGEVSEALRRAVLFAERDEPSAVEALGEGWVAEEALAIAVFCALTAPDFASGVLLAVNHSGDSDSTGSLAGNLLGTVLGEEGLPTRWTDAVEMGGVLRELADDLGRVVEFSSDPFGWEPTGDEVTTEFREKYPGF